MPSILNATTSSGLVTSADNSGSLQLATNSGTTAVTIDTSQNVGIGTATPSYKLDAAATVTSNFVARVINFSGATSSDHALLAETSTSSGARIISARNAGSERFSVSGNGDVAVYNSFLMNSGYGSAAIAFGCRAWVNFNGTGSIAIRGSGNVSSLTDNGTGQYTVNLATAMPDTNGSVTGGGFYFSGLNSNGEAVQCALSTTSAVKINTGSTSSFNDFAIVNIAVFR
jgi:hypothetical protein